MLSGAMRTRRVQLETEVSPDVLAESLAPMGYRRIEDRFDRGGVLLTETVDVHPGELVYRYATARPLWGSLGALMGVAVVALTYLIVPRSIAWLAAREIGPHTLLSVVLYGLGFIVCMVPFTWIYAALSAPGCRRERASLDALQDYAKRP